MWQGMCGRYSITTSTEALRRLFNFDDRPNLQPRYNMAPTQMAPIVRERDGARHLDMLRWGLLPKWSKDASGAAAAWFPPMVSVNGRCAGKRSNPAASP
jgi:putative SOS response-associated peptidase YedK